MQHALRRVRENRLEYVVRHVPPKRGFIREVAWRDLAIRRQIARRGGGLDPEPLLDVRARQLPAEIRLDLDIGKSLPLGLAQVAQFARDICNGHGVLSASLILDA